MREHDQAFVIVVGELVRRIRGAGIGEALQHGGLALGLGQDADEFRGFEPRFADHGVHAALKDDVKVGAGPDGMAFAQDALPPDAQQGVAPVAFLRPLEEGGGCQAGVGFPP